MQTSLHSLKFNPWNALSLRAKCVFSICVNFKQNRFEGTLELGDCKTSLKPTAEYYLFKPIFEQICVKKLQYNGMKACEFLQAKRLHFLWGN